MVDIDLSKALPTRQINLPISSRYLDTQLYQIVDDSRRRGSSIGRKVLDQSRDLVPSLKNKVLKRANIFVWGVWKRLDISQRSDDVTHTVQQGNGGRLDQIAQKFFNNPNLWWVIAQENNISDPLETLSPGTRLRIPSLDNVMSTLLDTSTQRIKPIVEGVIT